MTICRQPARCSSSPTFWAERTLVMVSLPVTISGAEPSRLVRREARTWAHWLTIPSLTSLLSFQTCSRSSLSKAIPMGVLLMARSSFRDCRGAFHVTLRTQKAVLDWRANPSPCLGYGGRAGRELARAAAGTEPGEGTTRLGGGTGCPAGVPGSHAGHKTMMSAEAVEVLAECGNAAAASPDETMTRRGSRSCSRSA